jgi:hypothetical protein
MYVFNWCIRSNCILDSFCGHLIRAVLRKLTYNLKQTNDMKNETFKFEPYGNKDKAAGIVIDAFVAQTSSDDGGTKSYVTICGIYNLLINVMVVMSVAYYNR